MLASTTPACFVADRVAQHRAANFAEIGISLFQRVGGKFHIGNRTDQSTHRGCLRQGRAARANAGGNAGIPAGLRHAR